MDIFKGHWDGVRWEVTLIRSFRESFIKIQLDLDVLKIFLELLWWLGWWSQLESRLAIGLSVNIHTSLKAFQKLTFRLKFSSLFLSLLWVDSTCSSLLWRSVTPSRAIYSTIIILFQQSKFHYYIGFVSILHCLFSLSILCAAVTSAGFRTFLRCVTDFFYDVY